MIFVSLAFWLALLAPGYVVVRRLFPQTRDAGLPAAVSLSFLATLALLTPVSIACFLLHAPLAIMSAACVMLTAWGVIEIVRKRLLREVGGVFVGALGVEMLLLIADMWCGARVGGVLYGDALEHLARIRQFLDHGLTNENPFVAGEFFYPIYHTNLWHALVASGAQLTRQDHIAMWAATLPLAKLLVASGVYFLAWSVFERRWAAWAAALAMLAAVAPLDYLNYPNKLAPFWLTPVATGIAIQTFRARTRWAHVLALAATTLALGQIHSLYAVFAVIALGPLLSVGWAYAAVRRRPDHWRRLACLGVLLLGLPFAGVTHLQTRPPANAGPATASVSQAEQRARQKFVKLGDGWRMNCPTKSFGGAGGWRLIVLGAAALGAAVTRRRAAIALLGVIAAVAAVLYAPPLCTAALAVCGRAWILLRLEALLVVAFVVLVFGGLAFWLDRGRRAPAVRAFLAAIAVFGGLHLIPQSKAAARMAYWRNVCDPTPRADYQRVFGELRATCAKSLPPGAVVLSDQLGDVVVAAYDCRLPAPCRGGAGVPNVSELRRDRAIMLHPDAPWEQRVALLRKHNVRHVVMRLSRSHPAPPWVEQHIKSATKSNRGGFWVIELDLDGAP